MPSAACDVANVKAYSSACLVSSCNTGWKVSEDKSECLANKCSCPNGIASTGAKCVSDQANICESCDDGFKAGKKADITVACTGKLWLAGGTFVDRHCSCGRMAYRGRFAQ